ncbi:tetratricopeptide repeat protein 5 isoform X2 [Xenopus laevis]|uniref:Tetratricopeptide repeat protein 5 isoform X2 n=1 Tax=Xenopus laevis TaxID=8355 RepID=A0A8J1M381_XENLA|nr:tetratricopeptide repeat protein 5 isoform X2 [Xenopus laevis]
MAVTSQLPECHCILATRHKLWQRGVRTQKQKSRRDCRNLLTIFIHSETTILRRTVWKMLLGSNMMLKRKWKKPLHRWTRLMCKNKVSLRNLSMVMRQQRSQDSEENSRNIMDSVKEAKQAVQMDPQDGTSWYILGNAYLSLFFCTGQNPKISQQALNAYVQAERVDKTASSNPDLHLNRATLCKYEERFEGALEGFSQAAALEPSWTEPVMREQQLLDYLGKLCGLLSNKGKIRGKRLQNMLSSLTPSLLGHFGGSGGLEFKPLSSLEPGRNPGCVVLGRVVFSLMPEERVPFTFGLVDAEGTCYAVMVYNMVESWGVLIADSVTIPDPQLKQHNIKHKGQMFSFQSIRVDSPVQLLVNGKPQGPSTQASAIVAYRPQSD